LQNLEINKINFYRKQLKETQSQYEDAMALSRALAGECLRIRDGESSDNGPLWDTISYLGTKDSPPINFKVSILKLDEKSYEDSQNSVYSDNQEILNLYANEQVRQQDEIENLKEEIEYLTRQRLDAEGRLAELHSEVAVLRTQNENLSLDKKRNLEELVNAKNEVQALSQRKLEVEHNLRTSQFRENEAIVFLRQFRRFYRNVLKDKAAHGAGSIEAITQELTNVVPNAPDLMELRDIDRLLFESGLLEEHEIDTDKGSGSYLPSKDALLRSAAAAQKAATVEAELSFTGKSNDDDDDNDDDESNGVYVAQTITRVNGPLRLPGPNATLNLSPAKLDSKSNILDETQFNSIGDAQIDEYNETQIDMRADESNEIVNGAGAGADAGAGTQATDDKSQISADNISVAHSIARVPATGTLVTKRQRFLKTPAGTLTAMREKDYENELMQMSQRCIELQMALNEERAVVDALTNKSGGLSKKRLAQDAISLRQQVEKKTASLTAIAWKMNELNLINKTYNEKMANREQHVLYLEEQLVEIQNINRRLIGDSAENERKLREEIENLQRIVAGMTVPLWQFGEKDIHDKPLTSRIVITSAGGDCREDLDLPKRRASLGEEEAQLEFPDFPDVNLDLSAFRSSQNDVSVMEDDSSYRERENHDSFSEKPKRPKRRASDRLKSTVLKLQFLNNLVAKSSSNDTIDSDVKLTVEKGIQTEFFHSDLVQNDPNVNLTISSSGLTVDPTRLKSDIGIQTEPCQESSKVNCECQTDDVQIFEINVPIIVPSEHEDVSTQTDDVQIFDANLTMIPEVIKEINNANSQTDEVQLYSMEENVTLCPQVMLSDAATQTDVVKSLDSSVQTDFDPEKEYISQLVQTDTVEFTSHLPTHDASVQTEDPVLRSIQVQTEANDLIKREISDKGIKAEEVNVMDRSISGGAATSMGDSDLKHVIPQHDELDPLHHSGISANATKSYLGSESSLQFSADTSSAEILKNESEEKGGNPIEANEIEENSDSSEIDNSSQIYMEDYEMPLAGGSDGSKIENGDSIPNLDAINQVQHHSAASMKQSNSTFPSFDSSNQEHLSFSDNSDLFVPEDAAEDDRSSNDSMSDQEEYGEYFEGGQQADDEAFLNGFPGRNQRGNSFRYDNDVTKAGTINENPKSHNKNSGDKSDRSKVDRLGTEIKLSDPIETNEAKKSSSRSLENGIVDLKSEENFSTKGSGGQQLADSYHSEGVISQGNTQESTSSEDVEKQISQKFEGSKSPVSRFMPQDEVARSASSRFMLQDKTTSSAWRTSRRFKLDDDRLTPVNLSRRNASLSIVPINNDAISAKGDTAGYDELGQRWGMTEDEIAADAAVLNISRSNSPVTAILEEVEDKEDSKHEEVPSSPSSVDGEERDLFDYEFYERRGSDRRSSYGTVESVDYLSNRKIDRDTIKEIKDFTESVQDDEFEKMMGETTAVLAAANEFLVADTEDSPIRIQEGSKMDHALEDHDELDQPKGRSHGKADEDSDFDDRHANQQDQTLQPKSVGEIKSKKNISPAENLSSSPMTEVELRKRLEKGHISLEEKKRKKRTMKSVSDDRDKDNLKKQSESKSHDIKRRGSRILLDNNEDKEHRRDRSHNREKDSTEGVERHQRNRRHSDERRHKSRRHDETKHREHSSRHLGDKEKELESSERRRRHHKNSNPEGNENNRKESRQRSRSSRHSEENDRNREKSSRHREIGGGDVDDSERRQRSRRDDDGRHGESRHRSRRRGEEVVERENRRNKSNQSDITNERSDDPENKTERRHKSKHRTSHSNEQPENETSSNNLILDVAGKDAKASHARNHRRSSKILTEDSDAAKRRARRSPNTRTDNNHDSSSRTAKSNHRDKSVGNPDFKEDDKYKLKKSRSEVPRVSRKSSSHREYTV
jgi:hypothetical protein